MILPVVIEGRVRLVHPVLVRTAVILRLMIVLCEDILQPDVFKGDLGKFPVHQSRLVLTADILRAHRRIVEFDFVDEPGVHVARRRADGVAVAVSADIQPCRACFDGGALVHGARCDLLAVEVHCHRARRAVKRGSDVIPLILGQRMPVIPELDKPIADADLKAPRAVAVVAEQHARVARLIVLADNGGEVFRAVLLGIGIVPLEHAGRDPGRDCERTAGEDDIVLAVTDIVGVAVHQK